jgi:hypothetical protein
MNKQDFLRDTKTNFTVQKRALFDQDNNPSGGYGVYRTDTNSCLGLVGEKYTIFQNEEMLDMLIEASTNVQIQAQSGGIIENGKKIYYQFPLQDMQIGNSTTKRFITALTSHDGSSPIGFGITNVNVYCSNTFYRAMREMSKVKHTTSYRDSLNKIVENLRGVLLEEQLITDNLIGLSNVSIPTRIDDDFLMAIIGGSEESTRSKNRLDSLKSAISIEENIHGNNLFSLFNGVTRFTNHLTNYRDLDAKRKSIVYGTGYNINNRAYDMLVDNFLKAEDTLSTVL